MKQASLSTLLYAPIFLLLSACGGGAGETSNESATASADEPAASAADEPVAPTAEALRWRPGPAPAPPPGPNPGATDAARIAAATSTAQGTTNACATVRPFYWEIGRRDGKLASGSVNSSASTLTITATMPMSVASASKWIYGAYVAQRRNGVLNADDITLLSMRGGYTHFDTCLQDQTVDACLAYGTNGVYDPATAGKFDYDGGHMEKHASLMGLGPMNNKALAGAIQGQIGTDVKLGYGQPQLAGGAYASADAYALFLRKLLGGQLRMGALLGSTPVCTNRLTCPAGQAIFAPVPPNESWHYSVGHWVEDDAVVGDGAFSSPGALGFYPWIDAGRTTYGVLARAVPAGAFDSVQCGRLIRKAWMLATPL